MKNPFTHELLSKKILLVIHPVLFAIFPVVFLYAHNLGQTTSNQIFVPMLFSMLGTFLLWLLFTPLMKSVTRAALATTLVVLLFFFYGRIFDLLDGWGVYVPGHRYVMPGLLLVSGYCIYFIKIAKRNFRGTTAMLNVTAAVLLLFNTFNILSYQIGKSRTTPGNMLQPQGGLATEKESLVTTNPPDIYYIILDEYAHPDTIADYYHYYSHDLPAYLANKGFFIARQSRTMTDQTFRSITSSLNMEYIDDAEPDEVVLAKLENNQVAGYLRSRGYKFVYFGSWYDSAKGYKIAADYTYNFYESSGGGLVAGEFPRTLWKTTMLSPFYDYFTASHFDTFYRTSLIGTFELIKKMPEVQGPKFVFAHIVSPHEPFVFGRSGEFIYPANWYNWKDKKFYLGQYIFVSEQIKGVVNELLKKSSTPPIIIIQSDHGVRSFHTNIEIDEYEWQKIFNAYYLPVDGKKFLSDYTSPVNSFRIIFNRYFGANYELLED